MLALCKGNPPVTGRFPSQRTSDVENDSMSWRHLITQWSSVLSIEGHDDCCFIQRMVNDTTRKSTIKCKWLFSDTNHLQYHHQRLTWVIPSNIYISIFNSKLGHPSLVTYAIVFPDYVLILLIFYSRPFHSPWAACPHLMSKSGWCYWRAHRCFRTRSFGQTAPPCGIPSGPQRRTPGLLSRYTPLHGQTRSPRPGCICIRIRYISSVCK